MVKLPISGRQFVILQAAERIARERGMWAVTHGAVAKRCTVPTSKSTVKYYYGTKGALWDALLDNADDDKLRNDARRMGWLG